MELAGVGLLVREELDAHPAQHRVEALIREREILSRRLVPVNRLVGGPGCPCDCQQRGIGVQAGEGAARSDLLRGELRHDAGVAGSVEDTLARTKPRRLDEIHRRRGTDDPYEISLVVLRRAPHELPIASLRRHAITSPSRSREGTPAGPPQSWRCQRTCAAGFRGPGFTSPASGVRKT